MKYVDVYEGFQRKECTIDFLPCSSVNNIFFNVIYKAWIVTLKSSILYKW